jgi:hypothetical protein
VACPKAFEISIEMPSGNGLINSLRREFSHAEIGTVLSFLHAAFVMCFCMQPCSSVRGVLLTMNCTLPSPVLVPPSQAPSYFYLSG